MTSNSTFTDFVVDGYPIAISPVLVTIAAATLHYFLGSKDSASLAQLESLIVSQDWTALGERLLSSSTAQNFVAEFASEESTLLKAIKAISSDAPDLSTETDDPLIRQTSTCSACSRLATVPVSTILNKLHHAHAQKKKELHLFRTLLWLLLGCVGSLLFFVSK